MWEDLPLRKINQLLSAKHHPSRLDVQSGSSKFYVMCSRFIRLMRAEKVPTLWIAQPEAAPSFLIENTPQKRKPKEGHVGRVV